MPIDKIAISWGLNDVSGWGVFGTNLFMELNRRQPPFPVLLSTVNYKKAPEEITGVVMPSMKNALGLNKLYEQNSRLLKLKSTIMLHALGGDFVGGEASNRFEGEINAGFTFFEKTDLNENAIRRAKGLDMLFVGSSWNKKVLDSYGVSSRLVLQGIDDLLFYPKPRGEKYKDRFVIFSAGKLELRKGQDLVLEAFKIFREKHPEALLVTAWQNLWHDSMLSLQQLPHVKSLPNKLPDGRLDVKGWAVDHGVPEDSFVDLGLLPHWEMANEYQHADVALFTSRAEGGTNLPAMEAMASGIPCILSANTGHLDIIAENNCLALQRQVRLEAADGSTDQWTGSDVEEIVEHLETLFNDAQKRKEIAQNGADFMRQISWRNQVGLMLNQMRPFMG